MKEASLPEPWRSLAREWVPRLISAMSVDGHNIGGGTVRLLAFPSRPDIVDGIAHIHLGLASYLCSHPTLLEFLQSEPVDIGEQTLSFPQPWPEVHGIPGGLCFHWRKPAVIHGMLARIMNVTMSEVRLYPTSAVIIIDGIQDRVLRW